MIWKELRGVESAFGLYQAVAHKYRRSFLLESAQGPERLVQHSFIGFDPRHVLTYREGELRQDGHRIPVPDGPLPYLRKLLEEHRVEDQSHKFVGGLAGYVSYDFLRSLEDLPDRREGPRIFPEFEFGLYLDGIIFDYVRRKTWYFSQGEDRGAEVEALARESRGPEDLQIGSLEDEIGREQFEGWVREAKGEIGRGEIFQVVLSRRLRTPYTGDLLGVYQELRQINPSPYMYLLDFDARKVVGSSPEMLVSVVGRAAVSYPIAGTRPLGATPEDQARLRAELLADAKERAEHEMLVDLARNDLGRVCAFQSVRVTEHMAVETFSHVQHLVSRVEGELEEGRDALDAFCALFPAGTVSGAPKLRAMEIIDRLEPHRRGPYAGIVGYFSFNGNMDSAITIRTLVAANHILYLQAGAGIVADSEPAREWEETEAKFAVLRQALEQASQEVGS